MTEAEWLACEDPKRMIELLWTGVSDRKLRMFAVAWACCHVMMSSTSEPSVSSAIEACEQFTDGTVSKEELITARGPLFDDSQRHREAGEVNSTVLRNTAMAAVRIASGLAVRKVIPQVAMLLGRQVGAVPREDYVGILRCIFGNPFRPVIFSPSWRTDTVVSLARQMYEAREFGAMPVLADALQDAGCDSGDILSHCRDRGPHARGCWVVDLALGKG